jgi:outer membrane protein OmpA-like peptidoglycan-associated protein
VSRFSVRTGGAAALVAAALLAAPGPASADGVNDLPQVSDADVRESVTDIRPDVTDIRLEVEDVDDTSREGAETVVALKSDVLFAFGSATLPASAQKRIAELASAAPKQARLKVWGHTDDVGSDAENRRLSTQRARAVAAAVRAARPDLRLDVRGFGESRPVEPNRTGGKDNPEGRAANRRVELRYAG